MNMAEYGEELIREYLESENDGGQWFVLTNHKVKASKKHSPPKEIDLIAIKVNNKGEVIGKIFGEVKSWIDNALNAKELEYIDRNIFENADLKKEVEKILGTDYQKVVYCAFIVKNDKAKKDLDKVREEKNIKIITFKDIFENLKNKALINPTKYEPKCMVSHTIRHLSKVEMLK